MKNWLLLIPVAFVAWFYYTRSKFTFNFVGLKLKPTPTIILSVYNPTSESSTINSIVADIFYKGNRLGLINQFNSVTINANTRTNINLPLTADFLGFAVLIKDIATTGTNVVKSAVIEVKGTINVSGLPVSFNQTFQLS